MNVARNTELFQMKFGGMDICGVEDADVFKFHITETPCSNYYFASLQSVVNEQFTFDCKWFLFVDCRCVRFCVRLCTFFIVFSFALQQARP